MISSMALDPPQLSSLFSAITAASSTNPTVAPAIQTTALTEHPSIESINTNDALASILQAAHDPSPSSENPDELHSDNEPDHPDTLENSEGTTSGEAVETVENLLEAQQKAFQKFTSQLSGFPLRSPFQLSNLSPFLAALQQQHGGPLQQQFLSLNTSTSNGSSNRGSPDRDCDGDTEHVNGHGEPEDLSIGKEKKGDGDDNSSCTAAPSNWSYEEQFKQLYDISDDPKRKEWLDDWLSFMHRIGKPVTRIPIMAKQVLDLYELYRLVVQHGGLVEIINKKLWREITKGLNLPSSITSAAFTLRTQYQKYLYDYECERENLSTHGDLQAAIEGNRREGRRNAAISTPNVTSVGSLASNGGVSQSFPFPLVPHSAAVAAANSFFGKHLNAFGLHPDDDHSGMAAGLSSSTQQALAAAAAYKVEQLAGLEAQQRQFELFQRAAAEAAARQQKRPAPGGTRHSDRDSTSSFESDSAPSVKRRRFDGVPSAPNARTESPTESTQPIRIDKLLQNAQSTHMKLTSARTPTGENTMVVSLEVNGMMYQGVLFAVNPNGTNSQSALSLGTNATDLSDLLNGDST